MTTKKCTRCETELNETHIYCFKCGNKVSETIITIPIIVMTKTQTTTITPKTCNYCEKPLKFNKIYQGSWCSQMCYKYDD